MKRNVLKLFILWLLLMTAGTLQAAQTWVTWNQRSGLPGNNAICMAIAKGRIAVGTDRGIGLFLEEQASWLDIGNHVEPLKGMAIRSIDFDAWGNIWAATPAGLFCIDLEEFPDEPMTFVHFGTEQGLSTIDTEVLQVVDNTLYVGCFGGWLFKSTIFQKAGGGNFLPVNSMGMGSEEQHRIISVGITAMAMDYPGGGIYSTKGKGLLRADDGQQVVELESDWVNDFQGLSQGKSNNIIAVTQDKLNLIQNGSLVGVTKLPAPDLWITSIAVSPDEETDVIKQKMSKGDALLADLLGKRILWVGTQGRGLWKFEEGRWYNFTTNDSPLPSDNINRVYYLVAVKKVAVLSDAGVTMLGITDEYQYDEFQYRGSNPSYAKTFWPFMLHWGPFIYGYPSQHDYPVEPFISYFKIIQGKDLWVSHERGLSRYAFPSAAMLGILGMNQKLAGRYENPENDPVKNLQIEDNTVARSRPMPGHGESQWHHYCVEGPPDLPPDTVDHIYSTLDQRLLVGPANQALIEADSFSNVTPQQINNALAAAASASAAVSGNASSSYPIHPVIRTPNGRFTRSGRQLYSIRSQLVRAPLHPIVKGQITDYDLDFDERVWMVFDAKNLAVLNSTTAYTSIGMHWGSELNHEWIQVDEGQLPWPKDEKLLCVKKLGADIAIGTKASGLFILPRAHLLDPAALKPENWKRVEVGLENKELAVTIDIIDCCNWETATGKVVAILQEEGLTIYDGQQVTRIDVPKRRYTSMAADRFNRLWLGAMSGLLYITPELNIRDVPTKIEGFDSNRITSVAAAPDDAKYPFIIAVACDEKFSQEQKFFKSSDVPPMIKRGSDSPYRLRVINPQIGGSCVMLYDGKKWERLSRPGVHHLHFDQSNLWLATSCRIMRLYLPVENQSY